MAMIIGFTDVSKKGHLTSQLCFLAGLFAQYSEKTHLIISQQPTKAEHYLGLAPAEAETKSSDLLRLAVNGQLTQQLIRDYSLPLMKGLDYLDASFIREKTDNYQRALYEYLLEKAGQGYSYVFADLATDVEMKGVVDKLVVCLPQSHIMVREYIKGVNKQIQKADLPLLVFGSYFPDSKWTKKQLSRGLTFAQVLGIDFSYDLFDAFNQGNILDFLKRKYLNWEKEYKIFAQFIASLEGGGK